MNLLQDRQNRHFLLFLGVFCSLTLLFSCFISWSVGVHTRELLFSHEESTASALLQQGVSPQVIASAFNNGDISEAGSQLLQQIGHTSTANPWLIQPSQQTVIFTLQLMLPFFAALIILLITGAFLYLRKREALFQQADAITAAYAAGDYSRRLPMEDSGAIFHLFSTIDRLATALKAKNEIEHQSKEFLKNTISDISHQLKTPLAALNLYAEIISAEPDHPDTVAEFNRKSIQSLSRMERLIQLLLKMTRLDSGSVAFDKNLCRISELASRACQDLSVRAKEEHKQLMISGSDHTQLLCDSEWTIEALGNLIKNALDHTDAGDTVLISWQCSSLMLEITVEDTGEGIDQEDIHHIFKRFYRSRHSIDSQGIGLGLSLAKAIIEGQGGTISVQSSKGSGTVFTISFLTKT